MNKHRVCYCCKAVKLKKYLTRSNQIQPDGQPEMAESWYCKWKMAGGCAGWVPSSKHTIIGVIGGPLGAEEY